MNNSLNQNLLNCFNSTKDNPFMNYLNLGSNTNKQKACSVTNKKLEKKFYEGSSFSPHELKIKDNFIEQYQTNPVTTNINDQTQYAKFLFSNPSKCRDDGYLCKTNTDISKSKTRTVFISDYYKPQYLDIFGVYESYK